MQPRHPSGPSLPPSLTLIVHLKGSRGGGRIAEQPLEKLGDLVPYRLVAGGQVDGEAPDLACGLLFAQQVGLDRQLSHRGDGSGAGFLWRSNNWRFGRPAEEEQEQRRFNLPARRPFTAGCR